MLKFYACFEINDETGDCLSEHEMMQMHYKKITSLQKAAFAKFPALKEFALSNVANVDSREALEKHFGELDADGLKEIACYLNLVPEDLKPPFDWYRLDEEFLRNLLVSLLAFFSLTLFFLLNIRIFTQNFLLSNIFTDYTSRASSFTA